MGDQGISEVSGEQVKSIAGVLMLTLYVWAILSIAINAAVSQEIRIEGMESDLLAKRIIYSPKCFAYSDNLRTYPGVVDLGKLSDVRLKSCLGQKYFLSVTVQNKNYYNYNEEAFNEIRNFCGYESKYYCEDKNYYVSFKEDGKDAGGGILNVRMAKAK